MKVDCWFEGVFIHTPTPANLEVLDRTLIGVDQTGCIVSLHSPSDVDYESTRSNAANSNRLLSAGNNQLFIPGLVDLHIHAPQWPQLGKALHLPLQDWLQKYTFPLEARYSDIDFASRVYESLVRSLLSHGTTTAVYFATVHEEATELLATICLEKGQRAYVGRVAMDDIEQCPDYYRDANAYAAIQASSNSIGRIRAIDGNDAGRVKPIITPRFIPSCSNELLEGLGELSAQHQCHVQTHCSESHWEHNHVLQRLGKTDTQALAEFGLLHRHTVLAHSNFLTHDDQSIIKEREAGIAHCPLSNSYFADSIFPLRSALNKSIRIGLGTDISGGHSASLFDSCRHAISSSRMLEANTQPGARIDFIDAFYLATKGGADVLECPVGSFEPGQQFDALLIDLEHPLNPINEFSENESWEDVFSHLLYNVERCNIERVWVAGRETK